MLQIRPLPPALENKVRKELKEDSVQLKKDVAHIREWINQQPHMIANPTDQYIVSALRACRYSLEKFKRKYESHLTVGTQLADFLHNRDINNREFQDVLKLGCVLPLPNRISEDGPTIVIFRPACFDVNIFNFVELIKVHSILFEFQAHEDDNFAISGVIGIYDMSNCSISLAKQFNPSLISKLTTYFQKTSPFFIKQAHVVNLPLAYESLLHIAKSCVSHKSLSKLHLHGHDFESIYKYIPQNILPKEYGGEGPSLVELAEQNLQLIKSKAKLLEELNNHYVDERKRSNSTNGTENQMTGSFRQLNFD